VCGLYERRAGEVRPGQQRGHPDVELRRQVQFNDFFNVNINARLNSVCRSGWRGYGAHGPRRLLQCRFARRQPANLRVSLPLRSRLPARPVNGQLIFCESSPPFKGQTQLKAFGNYNLPYNFVVSAFFRASLDRRLRRATRPPTRSSPGRSATTWRRAGREPCVRRPPPVPLIAPQRCSKDRYTRLDLRVSKRVQLTQKSGLTGISTSSTCSTQRHSSGKPELRLLVAPAFADGGQPPMMPVQRQPDLLNGVPGSV